MKKALSVILAIIMIISAVPTAFAADECEHVFNIETAEKPTAYGEGYYICFECNETVILEKLECLDYLKAMNKWLAVVNSPYIFTTLYDSEKIEYFENKYYEYEAELDNVYFQSELDEIAVNIDNLAEEFADYLNETGAIKVLDLTEYIYLTEIYYLEARLKYPYDIIGEVLSNVSGEMQAKGDLTQINAYLRNSYTDPEHASQQELDKLLENRAEYVAALFSCLEGTHSFCKATDNLDGTHNIYCAFCQICGEENASHLWGEYVSDKNATENADGTKTAKCIYCDATDTVVDEGSMANDKFSLMYDDIIELIRMFISLVKSFSEAMSK